MAYDYTYKVKAIKIQDKISFLGLSNQEIAKKRCQKRKADKGRFRTYKAKD